MNLAVIKVILLTSVALLAFAGNSVLCRLALGDGAIDAGSFTIIRLLSGIVALLAIISLSNGKRSSTSKGSWFAASMLFLYAVAFSYAYVSLDTGTGALILFGAVQITMIFVSLLRGHRLHYSEWAGMLVAFAGFVYLVLPGVNTPSITGFLLMTIAGVAWGGYTLKGRGSKSPLGDTAYNFLRTLPFVLVLLVVVIQNVDLSLAGILLAVASGAIASGAGYTVWYIALRDLSATQAAVVQLLVPVIAAVGGVMFAHEVVSLRLILSSILVLGGIMMVVLGRYYLARSVSNKV
ncbi:MAG: DMT family transporter [Amphritea sp.]